MRSGSPATGLAGLLLVDKPAGPTSHDVVAAIRRATGERRIGHAGTLDPLATGLLLVLVGRATRLGRYLSSHDKKYDARIAFGTETDTLDAEGSVTRTHAVPAATTDAALAQDVLDGFIGPHRQLPPAYSAIKRGGVAAHRLARAGVDFTLEPRPVVVYDAALIGIVEDPVSWDVSFHVSAGTYVRSLARDIGHASGTLAHLSELRRTAIGAACVTAAHTVDEIGQAAAEGRIEALFADPVAMLGLPLAEVDAADARDGRPIPHRGDVTADTGGPVAVIADGLLIGVYRVDRQTLRAETVLTPGVAL